MSSPEMNYNVLLEAIGQAHQQAQAGAAGAVNRHLILRNWVIGAYLVEFEQNGEDRAQYGAGLLKRLSADLRKRGMSGASPDVLERMRLFFQMYPQFSGSISATASRKTSERAPAPLSSEALFHFSWSHFVEFIRLDDPWKRAFYENECLKGNWSVRQLQRQIESLLYERTGLSTDKRAVIQAGREQTHDAPQTIADLIRDPYVLEFTGLAELPKYRESTMETALLNHTDKDQTKVEYATGGLDRQLFVSRYLVALPKPEQLQELVENDRAQWEQQQALSESSQSNS